MKSLIVHWPQLPVHCGKCPVFMDDQEASMMCVCPITNEPVGSNMGEGSGRQESCPLKLFEK